VKAGERTQNIGNESLVTSEQQATRVFRAWERVEGTTFDSGSMAEMEQVAAYASRINQTTTAALQSLNDTTEYLESLRDPEVNGTTGREAALEASPTLDDAFTQGALGRSDMQELRTQLIQLRRQAVDLEENASTVARLLQKRRNGTDIDRSRLFQSYLGARSSLEIISDRMAEVRPTVTEMTNATTHIASETLDVPQIGDELNQRFTQLSDRLDETGSKIETLTGELRQSRLTLPSVSENRQVREQLLKEWKPRQNAATKITITLGELALLIAAGAIAALDLR